MPKYKSESPKREMTKRQLSHWQRENKLQRLVKWLGLGVIVAAVILTGIAIYANNVRPTQKAVFTVGDTTYNSGYLADALDFYGSQNFAQLGMYFQNNYSSLISYMSSSVPVTIQQNQIYKEAAAALEPPITVSTEEINDYIKENEITANQAARDAVYGYLLEEKLTAKFEQALTDQGPVEQRAVLAMFVESQSEVDNVTSRIANGETFNDIAEAESLDYTTQTKAGDLGWIARGVLPVTYSDESGTLLEELVFDANTQVNVYAQKEDPEKSKSQGYWLVQVTDYKTVGEAAEEEADPETVVNNPDAISEVKLNVMLLGSRELALQMKEQLENGADFATLAKANSQYDNATEDGGILDYVQKGQFGTALDDIIFADNATTLLPVGQISDPVSDTQATKGGYWLVQVTGIENKNLDGTNLSTLAGQDKTEWKQTAWDAKSDTVTDMLTDEVSTWAQTQAIERYNNR